MRRFGLYRGSGDRGSLLRGWPQYRGAGDHPGRGKVTCDRSQRGATPGRASSAAPGGGRRRHSALRRGGHCRSCRAWHRRTSTHACSESGIWCVHRRCAVKSPPTAAAVVVRGFDRPRRGEIPAGRFDGRGPGIRPAFDSVERLAFGSCGLPVGQGAWTSQQMAFPGKK
jgi:hypothetical protein